MCHLKSSAALPATHIEVPAPVSLPLPCPFNIKLEKIVYDKLGQKRKSIWNLSNATFIF